MKIQVWFASPAIFRDSLFYSSDSSDGDIFSTRDALAAFDTGKYDLVGEIDVEDIEDSFTATQNIHSAWNPEKRCRSSCVGDIFQVGEKLHIVEAFGYAAIR